MIEQNYTVDSTPDGDLQVSYKNALKANETQIHIMAYIGKADYVFAKSFYDEYFFKFQPSTDADYQRLYEHIQHWTQVLEYERLANPFENFEVKPKYEAKDGSLYCSQLFVPRMEAKIPHFRCLEGQQVDLNLFLRNGPDGSLYLNCSSIDLLDPTKGVSERKPVVASDDDDNDTDWIWARREKADL